MFSNGTVRLEILSFSQQSRETRQALGQLYEETEIEEPLNWRLTPDLESFPRRAPETLSPGRSTFGS